MTSIGIGLGSPAYSSERAFTALNFMRTALLEGHSIRVFLFEDAVFLAKRGQDPGNFSNPLEWLGEVVEGAEAVKACGTCCQERGLVQDELIHGVVIGSMNDFVGFIADSDRSVIF